MINRIKKFIKAFQFFCKFLQFSRKKKQNLRQKTQAIQIVLGTQNHKLSILKTHLSVQQMGISNFQTVIGLLNGMIGGTILVLPLLGIVVGYMSVILITILLTMVSGYTAYLIVKHLGNADNINTAILDHFQGNHKYSIFYNFFISITFWSSIFGYFHLLVLQIKGFFDIRSEWTLPFGVFVMVFLITLMLKKYQIGEKLLAYGIVSVIGYIIFLIWAQITSPSGSNQVHPFGKNYSNFSAILLGALSIHDFLVQVMIHNPNRNQFSRLIMWTYLFGGSAYMFMGLSSFAIINRQPTNQGPQIISDYFQEDEWQVHIIQFLYMVHLFTALPEYILISKVRLMQAFNYEQKQGLQIKQVAYIFFILLLAYLLYIFQVRIALLLQIGGSVMGFIYIILIPVSIHLKCVYFDHASGQIVGDQEHNKKIKKHNCQCDIVYRSKYTRWGELAWILVTIMIAGTITVVTLKSIIFGR